MKFIQAFSLTIFLAAWLGTGGWIAVSVGMYWKMDALDLVPGMLAALGVIIVVAAIFLSIVVRS